MTSSLAAIIPLALGIFAPLIALVVMRSRPSTTRANAAFCAEVFIGVIVAVVLTQAALTPALHCLTTKWP